MKVLESELKYYVTCTILCWLDLVHTVVYSTLLNNYYLGLAVGFQQVATWNGMSVDCVELSGPVIGFDSCCGVTWSPDSLLHVGEINDKFVGSPLSVGIANCYRTQN